MSEEQQIPKNPNQLITEKGVEFALGFDTPRIWATGVQAFVNGDFTMLVFREQIMAQPDDGSSGELLVKNVASIVLPTPVVREFNELLGQAMSGSNVQQ